MTFEMKKVDPQNRINGLSNEEFLQRTSSVRVDPKQKTEYFEKHPILRKMRTGQWALKGPEGVIETFGTIVEPSAFYPKDLSNDLVLKHPGPFDEREVVDHIELLTKPGDIVLDPFLGSGTTLTACFKTGRKGMGLELMPNWVELAKKRIEAVTGSPYERAKHGLLIGHGDCLELMGKIKSEFVDFIITSPPYFNIMKPGTGTRAMDRRSKGLATDFGDHPRELGSISNYDAFTEEINKVYKESYRVLKSGKFMVLIVADITPKGKFVPFHLDTIQSACGAGFKIMGIQVVLDDWKKIEDYGIPRRFFLNTHHHYALVFQKKDNRVFH
jgi:DNA modification methylase